MTKLDKNEMCYLCDRLAKVYRNMPAESKQPPHIDEAFVTTIETLAAIIDNMKFSRISADDSDRGKNLT